MERVVLIIASPSHLIGYPFFTTSGAIDYLKNGLPDWYEVVVFLCYALQLRHR